MWANESERPCLLYGSFFTTGCSEGCNCMFIQIVMEHWVYMFAQHSLYKMYEKHFEILKVILNNYHIFNKTYNNFLQMTSKYVSFFTWNKWSKVFKGPYFLLDWFVVWFSPWKTIKPIMFRGADSALWDFGGLLWRFGWG